MANEIKILVRTQNSSKAGFAEINKDVDEFAKKSGESFSKNFAETITKNLKENITEHLKVVADQASAIAGQAGDKIGDDIGRRAGDRITQRISEKIKTVFSRSNNDSTNGSRSGGMDHDRDREHVTVDVDVDKQSLLAKMSALGKSASEKFTSFFGEGFKTGLTSIFSGDIISTIIKGAGIAALGAALAPVLGAAIVSGILLALGGGVLAAGVAAAFKDPRIKAAAQGLKNELSKVFESFGQNFKGPLENLIAGSGKGGSAGLIGVLRQITPMIEHLGQVFGPVMQKLGDGFIGLLQNALPGILRAAEAAAPLFETLAAKMPKIGDAIGKFFDHIAQSGPDANLFFGDLLELVVILIKLLGNVISVLANMYGAAHDIFMAINNAVMAVVSTVRGLWKAFRSVFDSMIDKAGEFLHAAAMAFGWIPGIGPKLRNAEAQFKGFKERTNSQLAGITRNIAINVRFNVVGLAAARAAIATARLLDALGYAAGGIVGQAASGGARSGMTWVGEHGPELVKLPAGSQVHSNGDSMRMAGQGGGQELTIRAVADRTTERGLVDSLFQLLRFEIANVYGGDVELALGRG